MHACSDRVGAPAAAQVCVGSVHGHAYDFARTLFLNHLICAVVGLDATRIIPYCVLHAALELSIVRSNGGCNGRRSSFRHASCTSAAQAAIKGLSLTFCRLLFSLVCTHHSRVVSNRRLVSISEISSRAYPHIRVPEVHVRCAQIQTCLTKHRCHRICGFVALKASNRQDK